MLVVSGVLIPELESVSLLTIRTIVGLATPELALVQVDLLTISIRVGTQHKTGIMETASLKRCVTSLSTEILGKKKYFFFCQNRSHVSYR